MSHTTQKSFRDFRENSETFFFSPHENSCKNTKTKQKQTMQNTHKTQAPKHKPTGLQSPIKLLIVSSLQNTAKNSKSNHLIIIHLYQTEVHIIITTIIIITKKKYNCTGAIHFKTCKNECKQLLCCLHWLNTQISK